LIGAEHRTSVYTDELQRSTTEWAHAKASLLRTLPLAVRITAIANRRRFVGGIAAVNVNIEERFDSDKDL